MKKHLFEPMLIVLLVPIVLAILFGG